DSWITIPQQGRSESLNVAMAGTVVAMHVAHVRR
ncbi:MAG: RNA methyltransferase, partial [Actinobacteria bacterium]|nr:RNA methyltransferase [Actinomycetota bacterium]